MANNSGFIKKAINHEGELEDVYVGPKRPSLEVEVNVDVSSALKGLKAIQREAKEATRALKELESTNIPEHVKKYREDYGKPVGWTSNSENHSWFTNGPNTDLSQITTKQLTDELARREGVEEFLVAPHGSNARLYIEDGVQGTSTPIEGPTRILVNRD